MDVLIAGEFSGIGREAFALRGHNAWSCDIEPSEKPGQHMQCDWLEAINSRYWDLIIWHPVCTEMALSGNRFYGLKSGNYHKRAASLKYVAETYPLFKNRTRSLCVENPMSVIGEAIGRKRDQEIHPWQFGHGVKKATWLWLDNLPNLIPEEIVTGRNPEIHYERPGPQRKKNRSRSFHGILRAMANQWT